MKLKLKNLVIDALEGLKQKKVIPVELEYEVIIERTRDKKHGDYACNIAMILARQVKLPPRQLAEKIITNLSEDTLLEGVEIAGPGFINFLLNNEAKKDVLKTILEEQQNFGHSEIGQNQKVLVEFVSANPTGPLHVGHGRSAAYGSSLSNVLSAAGFDVTREYYVNDAGRQMMILAVSVWLRYLEVLGESFTFPSNAYKGEYVKTIAHDLKESYQDKFFREAAFVFKELPKDEPEGGDKERYIDALVERAKAILGQDDFEIIFDFGLDAILEDIKQDLHEFGLDYQNWFSERSLFEHGAIEKGIQALVDAGHTYENEGALWFKATDFGDEKDRVLRRANGVTTYFASDVAYHWDKFDRGYPQLIFFSPLIILAG